MAMSRVIKKKLYIVTALVQVLLLALVILVPALSGPARVNAAGFVVNAKNVYFDTTNLPNKDIWQSGKIYLQVGNWQDLQLGKRIAGTDIYYWDFSKYNLSSGGTCIFILDGDWDYINTHDFYRTTVTSFSVDQLNSSGRYCAWSGEVAHINGKAVYSLAESTSAIDHTIPGEIYDSPQAQPAGTRKIYFDASLSKLSYGNDLTNHEVNLPKNIYNHSMPYPGSRIYYYATANGSVTSGQMWREGSTDLWYAYVPTQYNRIRFTSWSNPNNENAARNGDGTAMTTIPTNFTNPTFYPDTSDQVIFKGGNRDGYWQEKSVIKDAEKYKSGNRDVVPISSEQFVANKDTFYVNSTFYDYYSDYELNGTDRVSYDQLGNVETFASHRNWVTFRQLSQAMSDYYKSNGVASNNTIYTGHYQPTVTGWGYKFADVAGTVGLYGWNENNKAFQVNNNSCKTLDSSDSPNDANFYRYATQNILSNRLDSNDVPVMYGTNSVELPHFNESFLTGSNSKNAVLGEVYHNVAFPFTKVDRDNNNVYYWSFDSAATTLRLKKNAQTNDVYDFFLDTVSRATITDRQDQVTEASRSGSLELMQQDRNKTQEERSNSAWSQNLISSGVTKNTELGDYPSNKYGFFPLNNMNANDGARYNYGFGTKIEFDFNLTSDGNVTNSAGAKYPITFNFSGDDDIWVFIDGKLVLDMGGDHGRTSGCINFSSDKSYNYSYSYKIDKQDRQDG